MRLRFRNRRNCHSPLTLHAGKALWVRVSHCVPGPSFVGLIEDVAAAELMRMPADAPILFEAEHVFEFAKASSDPVDETSMLCVGSRRLGEEAGFAVRALRVPPSHDRDSGWRFLCEGDGEDSLRSSSRVAVFQVGWLVHLDPALRTLLGAPTGACFERPHPGEPWSATSETAPTVPLTGL